MRECVRLFKEALKRRGIKAVMILLLILMVLGTGSAYAFNIPTGSEDVELRLDNTIRYTLMYRLLDPDESFINIPSGYNTDDGNRNFDTGIVSNRLDLLTEADLVIKKNFGVRVSGAFWYDQRYKDHFDNTSAATSNYNWSAATSSGTLNQLSDYADNRYAGPNGELLDAFIFAKIDAGDVPLYFKLGRHVYSWGQSLLNPMYGISYGQMPLDLGKANANPGIEVKELFRPTNMASVVAQITPEFQMMGQFYLQREHNLLPAEGTYFGTSDVALDGDGHMIFGGVADVRHGRDIEGARHRDFGIGAQWAPPALIDTTFGFYFRRFTDRMPSLIISFNGGTDMQYHTAYKSNINLYGLSVGTTVAGFSVGAEVSYREHMPLQSNRPVILATSAMLPDEGDILGPTGDVMLGLVNVMNLLKKSSLWDAGSYMFEFDYCRWMSVDNGVTGDFGVTMLTGYGSPVYTVPGFAGNGYTGYGRVTKDAMTASFTFSPQYLQVLPGLDLDVPVSIAYGLFGRAAIAGGNSEGDGNFGLGLNFTYLQTYKLNFTYSNFFGPTHEDFLFGSQTKGSYAAMKDRDFVSMTFKVSF